jgi:hypothetical protein
MPAGCITSVTGKPECKPKPENLIDDASVDCKIDLSELRHPSIWGDILSSEGVQRTQHNLCNGLKQPAPAGGVNPPIGYLMRNLLLHPSKKLIS